MMTKSRNRERMTRAQKQWDTIARHNYQPWPPALSREQRLARMQLSGLRHCLLFFVDDAAANYEALTGHAGARSAASAIREMIARLEQIGGGE